MRRLLQSRRETDDSSVVDPRIESRLLAPKVAFAVQKGIFMRTYVAIYQSPIVGFSRHTSVGRTSYNRKNEHVVTASNFETNSCPSPLSPERYAKSHSLQALRFA